MRLIEVLVAGVLGATLLSCSPASFDVPPTGGPNPIPRDAGSVDTTAPNPNAPTDCVVGSLSCGCAPQGGCALNDDGEQLSCVAGICLLPTCPPGDLGCICRDDDTCGQGDCTDGYCVNANCAPGSINCSCAFGGCDVGLFCQDGAVCVDQQGHEGGACLGNGACLAGNRCDVTTDRCVYCDLGTQGCACTNLGSCDQGLSCEAGNCLAGNDLAPENPACYTPCRGDLTEGGTERACSGDNLLDGCIGDASCVDGSCLLPGELKPTCESDVDCPFFQACLQGGCYSNCESNADCPTGLGCHARVCRIPCQMTTGTPGCGNSETCDSSDGLTGFCVAIRPPPAQTTALPQGAPFSLITDGSLRLSNLQQAAVIRIRNSGSAAQTLRVQKLSHRLRFADGSVEDLDTPIDPLTGAALPCDGASVQCPLWWLHLGPDTQNASPTADYELFLPGSCGDDCPAVVIGNAAGSPGVSYEGRLLVTGPGGSQEVAVRYVESVEGKWQGTIHYFTNFGEEGLQEWIDSENKTDVADVRNALIQRWGAFRRGNLEGVSELNAVLSATRNGAWQETRVQELCDDVTGGSENAVCYPYSNPEGVRRYVQNTTLDPVPSATTELPLAFNLKNSDEDGTILTGRIDSDYALQYPNFPALSIQLSGAPSLSSACDPRITSDCVVFLKEMRAEIAVGGRYISANGGCAPGYLPHTVPWLLPDFTELTHDYEGVRSRTECRDSSLPFDDADLAEQNAEQASANPTPDGKPRVRTIELLDGALINQSTLFFLFRESFPSFLPAAAPVSAYGFVSMKRSAAEIDDDDLVGLAAPDVVKNPPVFGATCSADFLEELGVSQPLSLAPLLLDGSVAKAGSVVGGAMTSVEVARKVHFLCAGKFDGGGGLEETLNDPFAGGDPPLDSGYVRDGDGNLYIVTPSECLPGEDVVFFYTNETLGSHDVLSQSCNESETCRQTLSGWVASGRIIDEDPIWRCTDPSRALCNDDLADRRVGKDFFIRSAPAAESTLTSLSVSVDNAFRYKTRFTSGLDDNLGVGFTPLLCLPNSDARPYCYEPDKIEELRDRFDCLVNLYSNHRSELTPAVQSRVDAALRSSFSEDDTGLQGFERLYAELTVMLGDEELTSAFASRFDLAGVDTESFEGALFETDGLNLSSVAGAEMAKLYRSVQYYSLAIDRFYRFGPHFARALSLGDTSSPTNFISPQTATLYLPRVVRASAQRAFAWSEIAKRYRDFNRPELAKRVLTRAYAQTYLESVMIARMMIDINERSQGQFRDQIAFELLTAQRTFRVALLDMREVFDEVSQGTTFFGFPREYVPFPAVDSTLVSANGFEVLLNTARTKMLTAKEREQIAFDSLISSRLDVAQFQNELVRIRNSFEDQLETICGTFVGDDGATYPATKKYAMKSDLARVTGDPCGTFSTGTLYEQMLQVDAATTALDGVLTRYRNARADIRDEQRRVQQQCDLANATAEYEYNVGAEIRDLDESLRIAQLGVGTAVKALGIANEGIQQYANCVTAPEPISKGACAGLATVGVGFGVVSAALEFGLDVNANNVQNDIQNKRLDTARWVTEGACLTANVEAARIMAQMIRGLDEIVLEALRSEIALQIELAQVSRTQNEAARLQERQAEAQQHLINVESARNDPNVRIFRNESIINADIAFEDAIRGAYRATRMYEYYTSTSYARLEQLFLIRLAAKGTVNLENYLIDLENAFADFEEELGLPDARVAIYSLRDDILQVPFLGDSGEPISQSDRISRMQRMLADPNRLDKNGYITIPFGTAFEQLSPLTRNHKIRYIEANVIGSNVGDRIGRIYLRQRGTSILQSVDDSLQYYVFPKRTAVVDVFYNGNRVFPPEVYQNFRLRDRPVAQTMWELVINQRDEEVNRDIDLGSVSDIQIFIHYTDFTVF